MYVLAIDTSTDYVVSGIVHVDEEGLSLCAQRIEDNPRGHAEVLVPHIQDCLEELSLKPQDLGAVVVGCGPGPFTGLRVGMATAAAYGDALGIPVHGVVSHAAMDRSLGGFYPFSSAEEKTLVLVLSDARRREWYGTLYSDHSDVDGPWVKKPEQAMCDIADFAATQGVSGRVKVLMARNVAQQWHRREAEAKRPETDMDACSYSDFCEVVSEDSIPYPLHLVEAAINQLRGRHGQELRQALSVDPTHEPPQLPADELLLAWTAAPLSPLYLRRPDAAEPKKVDHSAVLDFGNIVDGIVADSTATGNTRDNVVGTSKSESKTVSEDSTDITTEHQEVFFAPLYPHHAQACADIEQKIFADESPWTVQAFREEISSPHTVYIGAFVPRNNGHNYTVASSTIVTDRVHQATLVGYAGIALHPEPQPAEAEIHTIGIHPDYQGRGYGHRLLQPLLAVAEDYQARTFLEVRTTNYSAIGLYRRYGFQELGVRKNYYQPSGADALTMRRDPGALPQKNGVLGDHGNQGWHNQNQSDQNVFVQGDSAQGDSIQGNSAQERTVQDQSPMIMGIESSCDETGIGVIQADSNGILRVRAQQISSSMEEHARFGGVVPEIASRAHLEALIPTMRSVRAQMRADNPQWTRPDVLAVTIGPGLAGALLVGVAAAKAYASAWGVPLYAVNHLGGHVAVDMIDRKSTSVGEVPANKDHAAAENHAATKEGSTTEKPSREPEHAIALLVSGGHTQLLETWGAGQDMKELGSTLDDAAGEAYDKVSRLIGLGYPGGPIIDRLAAQGNPKAITFPRGLTRPGDAPYDFSFSGLKTAVARYVETAHREGYRIPVEDLCASFQEAVVDVLISKAMRACEDTGAKILILGGGVSANRRLRELAAWECEKRGIELRVPAPSLCTDNGVMIAAQAAQVMAAGKGSSSMSVVSDPSLEVSISVISA